MNRLPLWQINREFLMFQVAYWNEHMSETKWNSDYSPSWNWSPMNGTGTWNCAHYKTIEADCTWHAAMSATIWPCATKDWVETTLQHECITTTEKTTTPLQKGETWYIMRLTAKKQRDTNKEQHNSTQEPYQELQLWTSYRKGCLDQPCFPCFRKLPTAAMPSKTTNINDKHLKVIMHYLASHCKEALVNGREFIETHISSSPNLKTEVTLCWKLPAP